MPARPLPVLNDPDTSGHWEAAHRGEVAIRRCVDCGMALHLPRAYCHACGGWNTAWVTVRPTATLYSYTVTERELRPGITPPYTVVVVELDDKPGVRLFGFIQGCPDLEIGMPMEARFERIDEETTLVQWDPK